MTTGPVDPAARGSAVSGWPTPPGRPVAASPPPGATGPGPPPQPAPTMGRPATGSPGAAAGPAAPRRPMTVGTAATTRRPGRRARLTVKRIDPWSTLKFSFFYGIAGMVVLLVCVIVLYGIVDAMGVISSLRSFFDTVQSNGSSSITVWFSFGRVLLVTIVVGIVNVVLFTAFATLTAFIYNVCTDIVGGIEVTLADRG